MGVMGYDWPSTILYFLTVYGFIALYFFRQRLEDFKSRIFKEMYF